MNKSGISDGNLEVLVIDDDTITIFLAKKTIQLSYPACLVNSFTDGTEALNYLRKREATQPLLILLDINMPNYSGWDFLNDFIKEQFEHEVFMFTSSIDPFDLAKSKTFPCVKGFISKPLNKEKLEEIFRG